MANGAHQFPFHTTESEKRILGELLQIASLRGEKLTPEALGENAALAITNLKERLFPAETRIALEREKLLKNLQGNSLRTHFDQTLETATLTINAKIRTAAEYRAFLEKLSAFDFEAWSRHCDSERSDAD